MRFKRTLINAGKHGLLLGISVAAALPLAWMVTTALKTVAEVWIFPPRWLPADPQWLNFVTAWQKAQISHYLFNTVVVAIGIIILQVLTMALAAYAFTMLRFPGRDLLFMVVVGTMLIPPHMTFVPSYLILSRLDWIDTFQGLIIPSGVSAFGIFLTRQAFLQIPKELVEAARVDGASDLRILWNIMFPLSYPTVITFAVFSFVYQYNNYFWPLIITNSERVRPIALGLARFLQMEGSYGMLWPIIMAANTLAVLPILLVFLAAQKYYIKGVTSAGLKG